MPPIDAVMKCTAEQEYGAFYEASTNSLEMAMYTPASQGTLHHGTIRTLLISAVGLLPVGVVSGMMLMQILGLWTY